MRDAAVLVPVFRDADGDLRIVIVVRADDGGRHGGQLGLLKFYRREHSRPASRSLAAKSRQPVMTISKAAV